MAVRTMSEVIALLLRSNEPSDSAKYDMPVDAIRYRMGDPVVSLTLARAAPEHQMLTPGDVHYGKPILDTLSSGILSYGEATAATAALLTGEPENR